MSHRSTVQTIYEAFGRGDVPAILAQLAEDVEWEHDAVDHGIPLVKPRRGRAGAQEFFASLAGIEITRFEMMNLLEGGDQVAVVFRVDHTHKGTKKGFSDLELHLWTFDQSGKVSRFRHLVDTHQLWLQQQQS